MSGGGDGEDEGRAPKGRAAAITGIGLHLLLLPVFVSSGLLAPGWAVVALCVVWALLLALAVRWRQRPFLVLAVPVLAMAVWAGALAAGDLWLDWTA